MKNALALAGKVIPRNPAVPILGSVLLDGNKLLATNLEQYLWIKDSGVSVQDRVVLEYASLSKISGKVEVQSIVPTRHEPRIPTKPEGELYVSRVRISADKGVFALPSESAYDFPLAPKFDGCEEFTLNLPDLRELAKYTSDNGHRPNLTGIYFRSDVVAVADGYRLQWDQMETGVPSGLSFILPPGVFFLPEGQYQARLNYNEVQEKDSEGNQVTKRQYVNLSVENDEFGLMTRLIDERYPDFESVIPRSNPYLMKGDRKELIETLKLALDFTNKTTKLVRFSFGPDGSVSLEAQDIDFNLEYQYTFKEVRWSRATKIEAAPDPIGFNAGFMLEYLQTQETKAKAQAKKDKQATFTTFVMEFSIPNRGAIFNEHHLLMPLMLNQYS